MNRQRWHRATGIGGTLFLAAGLVGLGGAIPAAAGDPAAPAAANGTTVAPARAFDFRLTDINPGSADHGNALELSQLIGDRGLVLNFVASWCTPCREELPRLQSIHASGRARVVCVAADEYGGPDGLLPLIEHARLTMPVLFAPEAEALEIAEHYDYTFLPATYLIDASGRVLSSYEGVLREQDLLAEIDKHLK